MVGGTIVDPARILTTAIALEPGRGEFALVVALGLILLSLAFAVDGPLYLGSTRPAVFPAM